MKIRLDHLLVRNGHTLTRSQAESYIRLGQVKVDGRIIKKPGYFVSEDAPIEFGVKEQYVSRAALKLASVTKTLGLDFKNKVVLDVGSSTGGFTDFALQHGAKKVIAVDVGTDQLHAKLRVDERVELHEKTDIRDVRLKKEDRRSEKEQNLESSVFYLHSAPDIIVVDVSFISLKNVLPHIRALMQSRTELVAMCKPQFEAGKSQLNKGVVKNSAQRRDILQNFELWLKENGFVILKKSDSSVAGEKGNIERFYLLAV